MIYKYLRVCTKKQEVEQQEDTIDKYIKSNNIQIDDVISETISAGIKFEKREISYLFKQLQDGDTLIVSEPSRLYRTIFEFQQILATFLIPKKIILIICNENKKMDCANLIPQYELMSNISAYLAQGERQLIKSRGKSVAAVQRKEIEENGFRITKAGKIQTYMGQKKLTPEEKEQRAEERKIKQKEYSKEHYIKKPKKGLTEEQIRISKFVMFYREQECTFKFIVDLLNKVEPKKKSGYLYNVADVTKAIRNYEDFRLGEVE